MTDLQKKLGELQEIASRATPGPWKHTPGDRYCAYSNVSNEKKIFIIEDHEGHDPGMCPVRCESGYPADESDAAHIAAFNPKTAINLILALQESLAFIEDSHHTNGCPWVGESACVACAVMSRIEGLLR